MYHRSTRWSMTALKNIYVKQSECSLDLNHPDKGFTQKDAAKELHVSQPRISNLLHGKIDLFSVGMLLDMMERAGFQIYKKMQVDTSRILNQFQRSHHHV